MKKDSPREDQKPPARSATPTCSANWIVTLKWPLKRLPPPPKEPRKWLPRRVRWFGWLFGWGGGSVQQFGGNKVNKVRHLELFRWHIVTVRRNEYYNPEPEERAEEYLRKWSQAEKENYAWRRKYSAEKMDPETKQIFKDAFGIDFDDEDS